VIDEQGRLDCLVNNGGYPQFGPVEDVPVGALHDQFDANVYGPHRLVREALPHMRAREDGTVVNVSSGSGVVSLPGTGAYSASKFALEALSDALRGEVEGYGVDVVVVQPGPVDTGFGDRMDANLDRLERSGAYETVYDFVEDAGVVGGENPLASPPEEVAEVILEAGVSPNPQARYRVGTLGRLGAVGRFVPDRLRDLGYRVLAGVL
jgi:NAD(P)-dependent dehydrogenase (short-subunit alcohol dehydrogenase family)